MATHLVKIQSKINMQLFVLNGQILFKFCLVVYVVCHQIFPAAISIKDKYDLCKKKHASPTRFKVLPHCISPSSASAITRVYLFTHKS